MNKLQTALPHSSSRTWHPPLLKTPKILWMIKRPCIYRTMDKKWVDQFFDSGKLMLSSFDEFSKHKDNNLRDDREGLGVITHINNGKTIMVCMRQGHTAYVLCGSSSYNKNLITEKKHSGFRINNTLAFAEIISREIPGFTFGFESPCIYDTCSSYIVDRGEIDLSFLDEGNLKSLLQTADKVVGDDLLFLKDIKHKSENEYRLLWNTSDEVKGVLDIYCPEARNYCTRFEDIIS